MKKSAFIILFLMIFSLGFAQDNNQSSKPYVGSRKYIYDQIQEAGNCKSFSISKNYGMIALYGPNGFTYSHIPMTLLDKLVEFNDKQFTLEDINISDDGRWCILSDEIAYSDDMYSGVIEHTKQMQLDGERIKCISFNDNNRWCIVSDKSFYCSDQEMYDFIMSTMETYGSLRYVYVSTEQVMVTCENGICWTDTVTPDFYDDVNALDFKPLIVKYFYDNSYIISNPEAKRMTAWVFSTPDDE